MTEHLKKQIEDAASDCRTAKRKWREADETVKSQKSSIDYAIASIASLEASIDASRVSIVAAETARLATDTEFKLASDRLSFFNRELIDHPYAGQF